MAFKIDIKEDFEKEVKAIKNLAKDVKEATEFAVDMTTQTAVGKLKADLTKFVTTEIRISNPQDPTTANLPQQANIPLARAEVIKQVFGHDLQDSNFIRSQNKNKTVNDLNNVFVIKDQRVKAWQGIGDSSTLAGELERFRGRIQDGVVMDYKSGKFFLPDPKTVGDLKLECSKDTGTTLDSEKKFDAYKKGDGVSRRGNSPDQRVAVMTMKQDAVQDLMRNAIPLDGIVDDILQGKYEDAKETLSRLNNKKLDSAITNIDDLKDGKNLPPSTEAFNNIMQMVRSIGIKKVKKKESIDYILTSSLTPSGESGDDYYDRIKQEINVWLIDLEDKVFKNVLKYITQSLKKYGE